MPRAEGEGRRVVLLGGEPGSGKSRLVREFAREAAGDGALVLYGACDAVVRTPYGPFVEALDHLDARHRPGRAAAPRSAPAGGELTRLLPDLPAAGRRAAAAGRGRPRHRAPPPAHGRHRPARRGQPAPAAAARARGRALGGRADARCCCATWRARPAARALLLLATFRDTEADVPATLSETLADLRRSDDVVRLRLTGPVGRRDRRVRPPRRRGRRRRRAARAREAISRAHRAATRSWSASCGARWSRPRPSSSSTARSALTAPAGRARHPRERARGRQPAALAAGAGDHRRCSSSRPRPGRSSTSTSSAAPPASPSPSCWPRSTRPSRSGMIEELPSRAARLPVHARARAPGALRPAHGRPAGRAAPARRRGARARRGALGPRARRPRAPLRRGRAARRRAARRRVQPAAPRARPPRRSPSTRRRRACASRSSSDREPRRARGGLPRARHGVPPGRQGARRARGVQAAAEIARELGDAELLARAAIGYEEACWRPGHRRRRARSSCSRRRRPRSATRARSCASACSAASPARSTSGATTSAAAIVRDAARSRWRAGSDDRAGLATVLMRSYWSRGTTSLEEILEMLTEAQGPRRGARRHRDPRRGDGLAGAGLRRAVRSRRRRGGRSPSLRETAEQTAQPFMLHVAEHYGSAIALVRRAPRRGRGAAQRSHEWSRLLTGRDASGVYGIQMFSIRREQGRLAELAPVIRILAGDATRRARGARGSSRCSPSSGWRRRRGASSRASPPRGSTPFRESLWLASLTYLTDACAALGDEATRGARLSRSSSRSRGRTSMIGHLVACYGAADRYLGMLAATLGEWERAERPLRARAWS